MKGFCLGGWVMPLRQTVHFTYDVNGADWFEVIETPDADILASFLRYKIKRPRVLARVLAANRDWKAGDQVRGWHCDLDKPLAMTCYNLPRGAGSSAGLGVMPGIASSRTQSSAAGANG